MLLTTEVHSFQIDKIEFTSFRKSDETMSGSSYSISSFYVYFYSKLLLICRRKPKTFCRILNWCIQYCQCYAGTRFIFGMTQRDESHKQHIKRALIEELLLCIDSVLSSLIFEMYIPKCPQSLFSLQDQEGFFLKLQPSVSTALEYYSSIIIERLIRDASRAKNVHRTDFVWKMNQKRICKK